MNLKTALAKIDRIDYKEDSHSPILETLCLVDDKESRESVEFTYEHLAFCLHGNKNDNPWGDYYYGPYHITFDKRGNAVTTPAFNEITADAVLYWERRYKQSVNPLLKMRYCGLVWDFKKVTVGKPYDADLYRTFVDAMLEVCNGDYKYHPVSTTTIHERLYEITQTQQADFDKAKQAYRHFNKRNGADDKIRYWALEFKLMLKYKKKYSNEEIQALVSEHEQRLARFCTPDDKGKVVPWSVKEQAVVLADYYKSCQQLEECRRVLHCIENAFIHEKDSMMKLQLMGNLEEVHDLYIKYGMHDEAKRLLVYIQKLGEEAKEELIPFDASFEIPQSIFDAAEKLFGRQAESNTERWANFISCFIPDMKSEEESFKKEIRNFSFMSMLGNSQLDYKGRPLYKTGSCVDDYDANLILHVSRNLEYRNYLLNIAIRNLCESGTLTVESIMNTFIRPSQLFEEDRHEIIEEALRMYQDGKVCIFCHLIVPQIESAVRMLMEIIGIPVLRVADKNNSAKHTGFRFRLLDELLREPAVDEIFGKDGAIYMRIVLTDVKGLNIRNNLCHGLLPPSQFGPTVAARLLHIITMLGSIRFKQKD